MNATPSGSVTSSTPEELLAIAEKQAGSDAMHMLVDKHLDGLMVLRKQVAIDDIDLLSKKIAGNRRLDGRIRENLGTLQTKMRTLIREVAARIEERKYTTSMEAIEGMALSLSQADKVRALIAGDKRMQVSCQSMKVAVEVFSELNKRILQQLENHPHMDPTEEMKLVVGNAIVVFELTDFCITFIEEFELEGLGDIEELWTEAKRTISRLRDEQRDLRKKAEGKGIDDFLREDTIQDIASREEAISILESEWDTYIQSVRGKQGETKAVGNRLPSLRLIRDNAKAQINTLEAVAVLQIARKNIRAIEATIEQLGRIELASLSSDRVKRLLGI